MPYATGAFGDGLFARASMGLSLEQQLHLQQQQEMHELQQQVQAVQQMAQQASLQSPHYMQS